MMLFVVEIDNRTPSNIERSHIHRHFISKKKKGCVRDFGFLRESVSADIFLEFGNNLSNLGFQSKMLELFLGSEVFHDLSFF